VVSQLVSCIEYGRCACSSGCSESYVVIFVPTTQFAEYQPDRNRMTVAAAESAPANPVRQISGQSIDMSTQQHKTLAAVEEVNQKRHLRERHVTNYNEDYVHIDNLELDERPYERAREDYVASVPSIAASHLELETAWAVVVNVGESILDEEEDLLPAGAHEQVYVQVRQQWLFA
jgi:hypothetical protein